MFEVADGVFRLGGRHHNFYLVAEGGAVTVVDAGGSAEIRALERGLAALRLGLDDVEAILLTHSHTDHVGFASLADRRGIPVKAHRDDVPAIADRALASQVGIRDLPLWRPTVWVFLAEMLRAGAHRAHAVPGVEAVESGEVLDLPGRPRAVHTPGHTAGHAAYVLEGPGILFAGDALVTRSPVRGGVGPQLLPDRFHADPAAARASLGILASLGTGLLLPGHGDPWSGPISDLVRRATG